MDTLSQPTLLRRSGERRRRRAMVWIAALMAVTALALGGLYAYARGGAGVIASGVKIGGVDVSGMSQAAAVHKVRAVLAAPLSRTIIVRLGGRSWRITARTARVTVNSEAPVEQAVNISRHGSFVSRGLRDLLGGSVNRDIALRITYSHAAVRALVSDVALATDRPAQNAMIHPDAGGLTPVPSRAGANVDAALLKSRIGQALTESSAPRVIDVPTSMIRPTVTTARLASDFPAYILVDRASFTLRFYDRLKLVSTYPIAVGMQGLETPAGLYHIQWEQINPPWYVPHDAWTGSLAGQVIPPGPQDPLKARFMSFDGGAGIHGIDPSEYSSIGHTASHGCIRMTIPAVIELYSKSPVGTPVYIL